MIMRSNHTNEIKRILSKISVNKYLFLGFFGSTTITSISGINDIDMAVFCPNGDIDAKNFAKKLSRDMSIQRICVDSYGKQIFYRPQGSIDILLLTSQSNIDKFMSFDNKKLVDADYYISNMANTI